MVGIQVTGKRLGIIGFDMEIRYNDVKQMPSSPDAIPATVLLEHVHHCSFHTVLKTITTGIVGLMIPVANFGLSNKFFAFLYGFVIIEYQTGEVSHNDDPEGNRL